jgi:hypothetical protein
VLQLFDRRYEHVPRFFVTLLITFAELVIAVIKSWDATFQGDAADVLLKSISTSLDRQGNDVYAQFSSIVNSTGTGKSRMVDQLGTKVITIPMCLRGEGVQGMV